MTGTNGCCGTGGDLALSGRDARFLELAQGVSCAPAAITAELRARLTPIPGGIFDMGARKSTFAADLDSPRRKVKLRPFLMSPYSVTTADYAKFTAATGYRTIAEQDGWGFVFQLLLDNPERWTVTPPALPWWRKVDGACWSAPEGPGSGIAGRENHPATHIAWYDALAYCNWSGLRLPTEAEWEFAARGGLAKRKFPWGDELTPGGVYAMNTF
ncbi:SUMF1/EgtB/PvdO family nonheme iron enzyme, partial [Pseudorhodobacter sp.]|uniref:SUMF1/EgtB/PvdO family nonheme iron enzyme n=1 Tax=Pseudorhodobacter sp. TaxID=1934400 RepID=UPI0026484374